VRNLDVAGNKKTSARIITVLTTTDLHQSKELYQQLEFAVAEHRPDVIALVGDCLHTGDDMKGKISVVDCASILSSLAVSRWCLSGEIMKMRIGMPLQKVGGDPIDRSSHCMVRRSHVADW
jgi:hypothetical protein